VNPARNSSDAGAVIAAREGFPPLQPLPITLQCQRPLARSAKSLRNGSNVDRGIWSLGAKVFTPLFSLIRHQQIQLRYRQSFKLRFVLKTSLASHDESWLNFVDRHREIISE
jgi:hypothetical protein